RYTKSHRLRRGVSTSNTTGFETLDGEFIMRRSLASVVQPSPSVRRRPARECRAFRPQAEGLEIRQVPTVIVDGGAILIIGSAQRDTVVVTDEVVNPVTRRLQINQNGQITYVDTNVRIHKITITAVLGDGNDSFVYQGSVFSPD